MKVYLNEISGLWQAIVSMYMSKRSWTREKEQEIMLLYSRHFDRWGKRLTGDLDPEFEAILTTLFKWAPRHITMGKFIDFSFTVEGLHRGAQDDFDSHAKRFDNRIIRSSTRLAKFGSEKSDWYQGKIMSTDDALERLGISIPETITVHGTEYVRAVNGYIVRGMENDKDVQRGLYMLSIPSNFTVRCNSTEFAHIVKERDKNSAAAPELRLCVEQMLEQVQSNIPMMTREYFYSVKN